MRRRIVEVILLAIIAFVAVSCDPSRKAKNESPSVENLSPQVRNEVPPLEPATLALLTKGCALIHIPDQPNLTGVILESDPRSETDRDYLILVTIPQAPEKIQVAHQTSARLEKNTAKKVATLPSGVSIYAFVSSTRLEICQRGDPRAGETWHAIRLQGEGSIPDADRQAMEAELETLQTQVDKNNQDFTDARRDATQARSEMRRSRGMWRDPRQRMDTEQTTSELRREGARMRSQLTSLEGRLAFPIKTIAAIEVASGANPEDLAAMGSGLDNTLLVSSGKTIRAIRHQGKWLDLEEFIASVPSTPEQVKITLNPSGSGLSLSCEFKSPALAGGNDYSMVAATTLDLESVGSGSIEERLTQVEPVLLKERNGKFFGSRELTWNRQKSTLWVKLFSTADPTTAVLDEVILLDYPDSFSARWGKPPSPLIELPELEPDEPQDLVTEQLALDAKGEIRDIVAAGDGSVVMVQTNQPPFWTSLDLKSGAWMTPRWTATADTLLASQAGKIYLLDRKTKVMEIWNLESGQREGMQLLPVTGEVVAIAAPLSASNRPVIVATDEGVWFLDPVKLEQIPSGIHVNELFTIVPNRQNQKLDPATIWLRASQDGTLYSISGTLSGDSNRSITRRTLTVDPSSLVTASDSGNTLISSRGRRSIAGLPDHGGGVLSLDRSSSSNRFPGPAGQIRIMNTELRQAIATLQNPPVLPTRFDKPSGSLLLTDRGGYLDSVNRVLLLPDGSTLHLLRLKLSDQEPAFPAFLFPGEALEIPLPPGTDHKLTSEVGGESVIGSKSIKWIAPSHSDHHTARLSLQWTGELGSQISKDYSVRLARQEPIPTVESSDGSKQISLTLKAILPDVQGSNPGFAGSGHVMFVRSGNKWSAWNLDNGEKLLGKDEYYHTVTGDADRIYVLSREGKLTSHDLSSGAVAGEADLGKDIVALTTGMAARSPLLAVERDKATPFLMQVDRDTLKSTITDFPRETQMHFFAPSFSTNASGSVTWSNKTAVMRDGKVITVVNANIAGSGIHGDPDAAGRYIVGSSELLDIRSSPVKEIKVSSLPGMSESSRARLDASGRYLLLCDVEKDSGVAWASVRDLDDPAKELCKIRYPSRGRSIEFRVVSGTNSLILGMNGSSSNWTGVYAFDIPAILRELAR